MKVESAIIACYFFTTIGFLIAFGAVVLSAKHYNEKRNAFNAALVGSCFLLFCCYLPMFLTTEPTLRYSEIATTLPDDSFEARQMATVAVRVRVYNFLYGVNAAVNLIITATRFKIIKVITPYPNWIDKAFPVVTIIVCFVTAILFGVIWTLHPIYQTFGNGLWSIYYLAADTFFSVMFILQLRKSRRAVGDANEANFRKAIRSVSIMLLSCWVGLIVGVGGQLVFPNDNLSRTLTFRISMCFPPIQFFFDVIFLGTIKELLGGKKNVKINRNSMMKNADQTGSGPKSAILGSRTDLESNSRPASMIASRADSQLSTLVRANLSSDALVRANTANLSSDALVK